VTKIDGQAVQPDQYWRLSRALNDSLGKQVVLTLLGTDGKTRTLAIQPQFQTTFSQTPLTFAGMAPRQQVDMIQEQSPARGQLHPGDVIVAVGQAGPGGDETINPSFQELTTDLNANGQNGRAVWLQVQGPNDAKPRQTKAIVPDMKVGENRKGLGVGLDVEQNNTIIAEVAKDSPAFAAGLRPGWRIISVGGHPVSNWFEVRHWLIAGGDSGPIAITAQDYQQTHHVSMTLTPESFRLLRGMTITSDMFQMLRERTVLRKTSNPLVAAKWGVVETRDFILQFYLTIKRMFQGSVSLGNTMGPVGIFVSGTKIASRGTDWLIWFLSVISANLAVVNFLPIPVVDGGLFAFLILEKIQGKPLSADTQKIVQMVGLALILGVFLLVTYHDITSHLFGM